MIDFTNLSQEQWLLFEQIWKHCQYFKDARNIAPENALANGARNVGSLMDDFEKVSLKKESNRQFLTVLTMAK
jgi:hypothetical protein